ncbi:MAG: hypothetical protein ACLSS9_10100 [Acutalibacteraceae bacterium]
MPAMITHYLFAKRVLSRLKKQGVETADYPMAMIGAQGPDVFFFHRVLPWEFGKSYAHEGSRLHHISPAKLFEAFRRVLNQHPDDTALCGYVDGFFCHYALDRAAHPFVYYWQEELARRQPGYGTTPNQYHFRIESALDTLTLRRETGRLIRDFRLASVLPSTKQADYGAVGRLYRPVFASLLGVDAPEAQLSLAPGDMRQAMILMTDRSEMRQKLLHGLERVARQGHILTSLLRPVHADDWDYANEEHRRWSNPFDSSYSSHDGFFDIYDLAAAAAADMIRAFHEALPAGRSMLEITQDRGFGSDLPGVYDRT